MKWIKINESSTDTMNSSQVNTEFKNEVRKMGEYLKSIEPQRKEIASQLQKIFDMVHSSPENKKAFIYVYDVMNYKNYGTFVTVIGREFIEFAHILRDMYEYYQEHNGDISNYLPMGFNGGGINPAPDIGDEYDIVMPACKVRIKSRNYAISYENDANDFLKKFSLRSFLKMSNSEIEKRGMDDCVKMLFLKFARKGYMENCVNSVFTFYDKLIHYFNELFDAKITGRKIGDEEKPNKLPSWHIDYEWSVDGGEINKEQGDYEAETEKDAIKMLKRELRDQIENEYPDYEDIDFNIIKVRQN